MGTDAKRPWLPDEIQEKQNKTSCDGLNEKCVPPRLGLKTLGLWRHCLERFWGGRVLLEEAHHWG